MEGVDHRKVPEVLRELERDGQVQQIEGEQDALGAKMGAPPLMEWHRVYREPAKKQVSQGSLF
jgi:hypothetical protein